MLNQFCLRMGTELVSETLYSNELTRLCAREDYIESEKYYTGRVTVTSKDRICMLCTGYDFQKQQQSHVAPHQAAL
jgi:hypothetical protein